MATEKELHEMSAALEAKLSALRAELDQMDEDERVRLGGILRDISEKLDMGGMPPRN